MISCGPRAKCGSRKDFGRRADVWPPNVVSGKNFKPSHCESSRARKLTAAASAAAAGRGLHPGRRPSFFSEIGPIEGDDAPLREIDVRKSVDFK